MGDDRRTRWEERHAAAPPPGPPSPFVADALALLAPRAGRAAPRALDVACGGGRHALLLAHHGYRVVAVDWARPAVAALVRRARAERLAITGLVADVTAWPFHDGRFDLVVVVDFLERALFPALRAAVAPGGALIVETFLAGQERFGHPRSPEFLLRPGELRAVCAGWTVRAAFEGETSGAARACRAGIVATRPLAR